MKQILKEIKEELENIDINKLDFSKLSEESEIVLTADLRQTLFKIKFLKKLNKN